MEETKSFKPYIAPGDNVAEFTAKSIILGSLFGVLFGWLLLGDPLTENVIYGTALIVAGLVIINVRWRKPA